MKYLNEKIECYFTPDARKALSELERAGFEKDLAVAVLEQLWTEEAIYDIPLAMEPVWTMTE